MGKKRQHIPATQISKNLQRGRKIEVDRTE
jgi:hypothetical protein